MQLFASFSPYAAPIAVFLLTLVAATSAQESTWFEKKGEWKGYEQFHFTVAERPAYIVVPKTAGPGKPWVWRARFPGYHSEMDEELLGQGFHVAYVDVAGMFGSPKSMDIGDAFYKYLTTEHGFGRKPALEGVSRGGLFVYNWAVKNPTKVACIYCDTPVCDFTSWPGGKGQGVGADREWEQCKKQYGLSEQQAIDFANHPVDLAETFASAAIPLLTIVSENDVVVPPKENTYVLRDRLANLGHQLDVISVPEGTEKSKGHHFDHPDPDRVVEFIARHANPIGRGELFSERMAMLTKSKRVVLLGDSITFAGHHWAYFDAWLQTKSPDERPILINVGLPSETVSGLSEEGHAGGRFPRPDLAERLDRVLKVTKPDLVFACYGINCGIYQPFDKARLGQYQSGIRNLKSKVEAAHAKLVLIAPPTFDDHRKPNDFSYNDVMGRYAAWLLGQRVQGWTVVDLHGPMTRALERKRVAKGEFTFQPDAVHPNDEGYWFIASELVGWFGDESLAGFDTSDQWETAVGLSEERFSAIRRRMDVRRNAYLSAAGHKRPGVKPGLSIKEAEERAKNLTDQIEGAR